MAEKHKNYPVGKELRVILSNLRKKILIYGVTWLQKISLNCGKVDLGHKV